MREKFILFFAAILLATSILGCNMLKGGGKDMENAGKSIQKTVDKND